MAMRCRERSRGALNIPGYRPAGIYSAGTAQRLVDIEGKERVTAVTIAEVDSHNTPIPGTEKRYVCDTLLLSCGLIPENELSVGMGGEINPVSNGPKVNECLETSISGVFAAGNVLHVHDLVDYVSSEAGKAGKQVAEYAGRLDVKRTGRDILLELEGGIRYSVPSTINPRYINEDLVVLYRVGAVMNNKTVNVYVNGNRIQKKTRKVMASGEMEEIVLKADVLKGYQKMNQLKMCIEEA